MAQFPVDVGKMWVNGMIRPKCGMGSVPLFLLIEPSFFAKSSRFPWVSGRFLRRRIPGKNGEGTPRILLSPDLGCPEFMEFVEFLKETSF